MNTIFNLASDDTLTLDLGFYKVELHSQVSWGYAIFVIVVIVALQLFYLRRVFEKIDKKNKRQKIHQHIDIRLCWDKNQELWYDWLKEEKDEDLLLLDGGLYERPLTLKQLQKASELYQERLTDVPSSSAFHFASGDYLGCQRFYATMFHRKLETQTQTQTANNNSNISPEEKSENESEKMKQARKKLEEREEQKELASRFLSHFGHAELVYVKMKEAEAKKTTRVWLFGLFVMPQFRRIGLASLLIDSLKEHLTKQNAVLLAGCAVPLPPDEEAGGVLTEPVSYLHVLCDVRNAAAYQMLLQNKFVELKKVGAAPVYHVMRLKIIN